MDLVNIYKAFHLKAADYIFFSSVHETFFRIDHILGHKISLNKFKKTEISNICLDHNGMKLENNYKRKLKNTNTWRLNNMLPNNKWDNKEIRKEIKIHGDK